MVNPKPQRVENIEFGLPIEMDGNCDVVYLPESEPKPDIVQDGSGGFIDLNEIHGPIVETQLDEWIDYRQENANVIERLGQLAAKRRLF